MTHAVPIGNQLLTAIALMDTMMILLPLHASFAITLVKLAPILVLAILVTVPPTIGFSVMIIICVYAIQGFMMLEMTPNYAYLVIQLVFHVMVQLPLTALLALFLHSGY